MRTANLAVLLVLLVGSVNAQEVLPIIDMHVHALAANDQGLPPVAVCTPINPFPVWDPAQPYEATFMGMLKKPPCDHPVWSPMTDEALMTETLEVMKRRNIFGVLSGTPDRVATWMAAAPGRFIPGLGFRLDAGTPTPDSLRALHAQGRPRRRAHGAILGAGRGTGHTGRYPHRPRSARGDLPGCFQLSRPASQRSNARRGPRATSAPAGLHHARRFPTPG